MSAKPAAKIEKINYQGWPNSYRMTNGEVELVIIGDIGPRIIRYAFVGGRNLFQTFVPSHARGVADAVGQSQPAEGCWASGSMRKLLMASTFSSLPQKRGGTPVGVPPLFTPRGKISFTGSV